LLDTASAKAEQHEDDRMLADFLAGKSSGLEGAFHAYGRSLYSIARHVLANDEDAQDCVHDALLRVWQRSQSYHPERGSLRSYLLACVRNEAITRKRNAARHLRIEERAARSAPSVYEPEVSDCVEREHLRRALAILPDEQRIALDLAYFGHRTHVQVAEQLGVPLGTIKSRLSIALRELNAALSQKATGAR
jgi:RNA polymerase sigma-70 factor (ECF subfamily)